ncbi:hypothetical protein [Tenacibaculum sp. nBUS_03]|uniref:hypothetical protein n=1 Tax=Tenacibaculum sp. nBUS_03 TaxID=3395320 RepID=UPI003EBD9596
MNNSNEIGERIAHIISNYGESINSFEKKISVSTNSIGAAIRKKSALKSNVLIKILEVFPEINPTWLLVGKGEMLLSDTKPETTSSETTLASLELDLKRKDFEIKGMLLEFQELKEDVELLKKITSLEEKYIDIVDQKLDKAIDSKKG